MSISIKEPRELQSIYLRRFEAHVVYRKKLWDALCDGFFQRFVKPTDTVLDLGCGYGEFINHIRCQRKIGMDLNPQSRAQLAPEVELIAQDCSTRWALPDNSLDVVFTSNFFEHLPDKLSLKNTILESARCLKPGGRLIALGPNIKYVQGAYWDFWDHFLCLTEMSLGEALENNGFRIVRSEPRFLPYTTVGMPKFPPSFIHLFLKLPFLWRIFGKQFLVIGEKL
ncbi:MAG TPA: class I SAM-dependent methyltransferase [Opitutaceae bacterium]|nr:class I SAM-dependent methyltransferase [Opitutaceae bacterium]